MPWMAEKDATFTLPVRLVTAADKDVAATGKTLTVELMKAGEASFTDITSASTETEIADGIYTVALTTSHTDTAGIAVLKITSSDSLADEYFERIQVIDYSAETAQPASLSTAVLNQIADHVLRRTATNWIASSDGDAAVSSKYNQTLGALVLAMVGYREQSGSTWEFSETSGGTVRADWTATGTTTTPTVPTAGG